MKITCPKCNQKYDVTEDYLGQIVECACGNSFVAEKPAIAEKAVSAKPVKAKTKPQTTICRYCKQPINSDAQRCYHCGAILSWFSLSGVLLASFAVISLLAGISFFSHSANIMSNAKSSIHQIYGELVYIKAFLCCATAFILFALSSINRK